MSYVPEEKKMLVGKLATFSYERKPGRSTVMDKCPIKGCIHPVLPGSDQEKDWLLKMS